MTTLEGNKLIANFDGKKTISEDTEAWDIDNPRLDVWYENSLLYHSSWDWLMPVVEKIEGIENSDNYEVDIFGNCCDIGGRFEAVGKTKIEATYKAVLQFIQWYNSQSKTVNNDK